jgi:hypothetical protein
VAVPSVPVPSTSKPEKKNKAQFSVIENPILNPERENV